MAGASTQAVMQAAAAGTGVSASVQAVMLIAHTPLAAFAIDTTQAVMDVATIAPSTPATAYAAMLVAYRTGTVENLGSRAWEFTLDGHTFYVLTLGEQGTFVYDLTTQQWAQWQTAGLPGWNMEIGTTWKTKIIAADQSNPVIWQLDPTSFIDDDYKPMTRKSTGGLPLRLRTFAGNYAFRITSSLGQFDVPNTLPETLPTVQLRYSDDQGKTFVDAGTLTIVASDFVQELQWLSLGVMQTPSRIFEITDVGAIARLDGADAQIDDGS